MKVEVSNQIDVLELIVCELLNQITLGDCYKTKNLVEDLHQKNIYMFCCERYNLT